MCGLAGLGLPLGEDALYRWPIHLSTVVDATGTGDKIQVRFSPSRLSILDHIHWKSANDFSLSSVVLVFPGRFVF